MKVPTSLRTESQHESCNRVHGLSRTSFAILVLQGPYWTCIWRGTFTPKLGSEEGSGNITLWWYDIAAASYSIGTLWGFGERWALIKLWSAVAWHIACWHLKCMAIRIPYLTSPCPCLWSHWWAAVRWRQATVSPKRICLIPLNVPLYKKALFTNCRLCRGSWSPHSPHKWMKWVSPTTFGLSAIVHCSQHTFYALEHQISGGELKDDLLNNDQIILVPNWCTKAKNS